MTTQDLIELSKQAAEVLGVPAFYQPNVITRDIGRLATGKVWLAEDSGRCAEIANNKRLNTLHYVDAVVVEYVDEILTVYRQAVYLSAHRGDRNAAWRVAMLKAVIEQAKPLGRRELKWLL